MGFAHITSWGGVPYPFHFWNLSRYERTRLHTSLSCPHVHSISNNCRVTGTRPVACTRLHARCRHHRGAVSVKRIRFRRPNNVTGRWPFFLFICYFILTLSGKQSDLTAIVTCEQRRWWLLSRASFQHRLPAPFVQGSRTDFQRVHDTRYVWSHWSLL
jgi:hypothetical protein